MVYDCGHKPKPHVIRKDDYVLVTWWVDWCEDNENKCFQCYRDEREEEAKKFREKQK